MMYTEPDGRRLRILELFAGMGAIAHATDDNHQIVAAIDINENARRVYKTNFNHRWLTKEITSLNDQHLTEFAADLWWLSPPCQPFTRRGRQNDIDDPRAQPMLRIFDAIANVKPKHIALENVIGFEQSQAWTCLQTIFHRGGYHFDSGKLCSSQFGVPNLRPRCFVVASREQPIKLLAPSKRDVQPLADFLDTQSQLRRWEQQLDVQREFASEYYEGIHFVDQNAELTRCFTSAYGRSTVKSGSYLNTGSSDAETAKLRRLSPSEIARLLGYDDTYQLPADLTARQLWKLLGNSVSIHCARHVLSVFN